MTRAKRRLIRRALPVLVSETVDCERLRCTLALASCVARWQRAQQTDGAHVEVLGLEALWSTTRGTAYTLDKARKAGLTITHITFERSKGQ